MSQPQACSIARRLGSRRSRGGLQVSSGLRRDDEFSIGQPFLETLNPCPGGRFVRVAHAETVPRARIHVQLGADLSAFALQIKFCESLGDVLSITVAGREENGRRRL